MNTLWTRRGVLHAGAVVASAASLARCTRFIGSTPPPLPAQLPQTTPWAEANAILAAIARPSFARRKIVVSDHGAVGDGVTDNTAAFARAIAACHAGGGTVVVPAGVWLVGAIRLLSGVELQVRQAATLLFSGDRQLYPPVATRYEGIECVNRSPMIYAHSATDVAVTGDGVLDASRTASWNRGADRSGLLEPLVAKGVPVEGRNMVDRLRTSFVQTVGCSRVLVRGVTLRGAQFWQVHPVLCTDVTIERVTTTVAGSNTDGCDPESCRRVVVNGCTLASGDDNIAVKSGRDDDGRRVATPCEDLVIMNCQAEGRFGFICLGSEQTGGIRNVYAHNNRSFGHGLGWLLWAKSNSRRGGFIENVHVDTFEGSGFRNAVVGVTMRYGDQKGSFPPRIGGFHFSRLDVKDAPLPLDVDALAESPLGPVTVRDSRFRNIASARSRLRNAPDVTFERVAID